MSANITAARRRCECRLLVSDALLEASAVISRRWRRSHQIAPSYRALRLRVSNGMVGQGPQVGIAIGKKAKHGTEQGATDAPRPMSMTQIEMRPATPNDYDFALTLYLESVKPLLVALNRWEEERVLSRFAQGFKLE